MKSNTLRWTQAGQMASVSFKANEDRPDTPTTQSLESELQQTRRALQAISACTQLLVRSTDENVLLNSIVNVLVEKGGYRMAWVGLAQPDEAKSVQPVAQAGFAAGYLDLARINWSDSERGRGPTGTAIRTCQPVVIRNTATDPTFAPWRADALQRGYAAVASLPLVQGDCTLGALSVYSTTPDTFDPHEVELLLELANDIAYGITALRTTVKQKCTEAALRESNELFRQFIQHSPVYTFIKLVSPTESRVLQASDNFHEMLGISGSDLLGKTMAELFPPDLAAQMTADDWAVVSSGKVLKLDEELNGRTYSSIKYPIVQSGRTLLAGYTIDITERKQAEAVLRRSREELEQLVQERTQALLAMQQQLQTIFDSSQDAIVYATPEGRLMKFNQAFEIMTGYRAAELRQMTVDELTPSEFRALTWNMITNAIHTGEAARYEKEYLRKDGTRVPIAITAWAIRDPAGRLTGIAAILRNGTEQRRLQREILEVSERERCRIGQDLHDDLCQMLTATTFAIGALEERLAQAKLPAAGAAYEIGEMVRQANREARNIAHGLFPVELEVGGLATALQQLANDIQRTGQARCELQFDRAVVEMDRARALQIYRIVQEAITNALRHGPATEISIVLTQANGQVCLAVTNNGRDWPAESSKSIGMGLNIMTYRTRMIGGTIQIRRGPAGGTVVALSFPETPRPTEPGSKKIAG